MNETIYTVIIGESKGSQAKRRFSVEVLGESRSLYSEENLTLVQALEVVRSHIERFSPNI